MSVEKPAFTITSLINGTAYDLQLALFAWDSQESQAIEIPAQAAFACNLGFGPSESKESHISRGYIFINKQGDRPFKKIACSFTYAENPLVDIPVTYFYHTLQYSHIYHWSLTCNDVTIGNYTLLEHQRASYSLRFEENCKVIVLNV